ncbi:MAG TPA: response regulator transcription factor [Chloroflexota bacterium]|nr:response regulator transcription factor [Chloroflexota bacterium]
MSYRILIVEDDAKIAASIQAYLSRYGYEATVVQDVRDAEQEFLRLQPHLVLMDINLPYQDGFHLTRTLRRHSAVPILFLSARSGEMDQVLGIESGGDDYVTKPFHLDVLHAKIKALLRRAYGEYARTEQRRALLHVSELELDLAAGEMHFGGQAQALTRNELKLLHLLMERAEKVVSREDCLEALWDDSSFVDDNTLTVNVTRLRAKLDAWGLKDAIQTRRGLGYQLAPEMLRTGQ